MRILNWYIGRAVLGQTLLALAVLLGLFLFVKFIDELADLGVGNYDLLAVVRFLLLSIPRQVYEIFPMAVLIGTMLGLSGLALESELVVMRASGLSTLQIGWSALKVGAIGAVLVVLMGELVTPTTETLARRGRAEAMQQRIKQGSDFGLWMRDHRTFINVGEVLPDNSMVNVRVFEFDENDQMRSAVYAVEGNYDYRQSRWRLRDVRQSLFEPDKVKTVTVGEAFWSSTLEPDILAVFLINPEQMSAWRLYEYIDHLRQNAQDTEHYELAFWHKLVLPVSVAVMVIIALPFCFGQLRSGGFGRSLFIGIMLGLGYYMLDKGFGHVVRVYDVTPLLGAITPPLLFLAVAVFLLRRAG